MNPDIKLKLFSLAETLGDIGHWAVDIQTQSVFWSDQIYVIHGVDRDTYKPTLKSAIEFYHPDERTRVTEFIEESIAAGLDFSYDLRIVRPSGEIRHVQCKAQCELNESGHVTNIFGIFRDKTHEVLAKEAVQRTQHAHRSLIESSTDGFWDWYVQTDYQYMSPRFWEMFGYTPDEKPHTPAAWQEAIFPEDLKTTLTNFQKHIDTKGEHPFIQEVRYRHKNGSTVKVLCRGKVIDWDKNGQPIRMIGTHTDITTMQTAQEQLHKNLQFQQLLININSDIIFVKDKQFRIVTANKAFLNLYPENIRSSVIGTTTLEKYDEKEAETFLIEDKRAFSEGRSETIEKISFPDGKVRTMQTIKTRFIDVDKSAMILCVARDITDLKQIEEKLLQANDELEEFAYRTSHDLRSPLISTQRLLTFMAKDIGKNKFDKLPENIDLAKTTLSKLETLVSDILTLSRLQNSTPELSVIHFEQILTSTLSKLNNMKGYSRITFSQNIVIPDQIFLQKDNVQQIMQNLLSNAIKYQDYTKPVNHVRINIHTMANNIIISVTDNGLGVPENAQDKLFSMFKRFHNKVSYGSGLGLYMIKKSIQKMNGNIQYIPLSDGSKFKITLPFNTKKENTDEKH